MKKDSNNKFVLGVGRLLYGAVRLFLRACFDVLYRVTQNNVTQLVYILSMGLMLIGNYYIAHHDANILLVFTILVTNILVLTTWVCMAVCLIAALSGDKNRDRIRNLVGDDFMRKRFGNPWAEILRRLKPAQVATIGTIFASGSYNYANHLQTSQELITKYLDHCAQTKRAPDKDIIKRMTDYHGHNFPSSDKIEEFIKTTVSTRPIQVMREYFKGSSKGGD